MVGLYLYDSLIGHMRDVKAMCFIPWIRGCGPWYGENFYSIYRHSLFVVAPHHTHKTSAWLGRTQYPIVNQASGLVMNSTLCLGQAWGPKHVCVS